MIFRYFYYIFGVIIGLFQVSFLSQIVILNSTFSLVMIVLLIIVLTKEIYKAYHFALAAGVILDIFSPSPFGLNIATLFLLVILLEMLLKSFLEKSSIIARVSIALFATFFMYISQFFLLHVFFEIGIIPFEPDFSGKAVISRIIISVVHVALLLIGLWVFGYFDTLLQNKIYQRSRYIS